MLKKYINLPNLTLLTALSLSSVAAWFAIAGLVAIFPAKANAIILMGAFIEVAKIVATVWLRKYWSVAPWPFKAMMIPMVVIAMMLTSMGTFGFLSGAHSEQSTVSGEVGAQVALIDEKIKTQRDNIELARKALAQMDAQVDARLTRGDSENGAERAVAIRRQQASERGKLQKEIGEAQATIAKLNEERAPIASKMRKVEAEVGPVRYIAALIYGDAADAGVMERAVRWVIILLVMVFDPFAIALVLAGNASKFWRVPDPPVFEETEDATDTMLDSIPTSSALTISQVENSTPWPTEWQEQEEESEKPEPKKEFDIKDHPYLFKGGFGFKNDVPIQVYHPESTPVVEYEPSDPTINCYKCNTELVIAPGIGPFCPNRECDVRDAPYGSIELVEIEEQVVEEPVTEEPMVKTPAPEPEIVEIPDPVPQLKIVADNIDVRAVGTGFGSTFPENPGRGDVFVRVDQMPNKVFKYDGSRWIEINKDNSDTYMYNDEYIQYLITKLGAGEYEVELLTENEKDQIRAYLRSINSGSNILGNTDAN